MDLLTVEEVAELLKLSIPTIQRKIRAGELPAIKIGRFWRIPKKDFEKWLENKKSGGVRNAEKDSAGDRGIKEED